MQRFSEQDRKIVRWDERGAEAVAAGDLSTARKCFLAAVRAEDRNPLHRFHLAIVLESLGDLAGAAEHLTRALRYDGRMTDAARRLGDVLARGKLPDDTRLDRVGLKAALEHDTVDRDLIAAAILYHLTRQDPLRRALRSVRDGNAAEVARQLCVSRTSELLKDDLLLAVLRRGLIGDAAIERLLTALRRVLLLETPASRFADPGLVAFLTALMQQCWTNEFAWAETAEETMAVDALAHRDPEAGVGRAILLRALYRSLNSVLTPDRSELDAIEPAELRQVLTQRVAEEDDIRNRAAEVVRLGPITGGTSQKVARQYEASPYPRWTATRLFRRGHYLKYLETFFRAEELAFAHKPFEVLIAGCGTGQQAVSAALDYGSQARVTGVDLSSASLGYASVMADRLGARNVAFAQGDLEQIEQFEPSFLGRFDIVECTGVLHHMADPFGAWQKLLKCLAPNGIMLIGLYSAIARRNLAVLKSEPLYPGPDCDDRALRVYRAHLMSRAADAPGSEYRQGRDFYSSSGFRDFFLHVSERHTTLPEIGGFLSANGLVFRGFVNAPFQAVQARFPNTLWPGSLQQWSVVEEAHPQMFTSMYQFWCSRAPDSPRA